MLTDCLAFQTLSAFVGAYYLYAQLNIDYDSKLWTFRHH